MATVPPKMPAWLADEVTAQGPGFRRGTVVADAWERRFAALPGVNLDFQAFGGLINREEMARLVDSAMKAGRTADAFVICMVWGHGPTGYGPSRTHKILTERGATNEASPRVVASLRTAAELASAGDDGYSSFFHLNNRSEGACTDFGPSFFTKWLYAVSSAGEASSVDALPIFDEVVRGGTPGVFAPALKRAKTADYVKFVQATRAWARELSTDVREISPTAVEEAIFDRARGYSSATRYAARDLGGVLS